MSTEALVILANVALLGLVVWLIVEDHRAKKEQALAEYRLASAMDMNKLEQQ